jgi:hypothetical protein
VRTCIDKQALSFDELNFSFADLVLAGLSDGLWRELIAELGAGLAGAAAADSAHVRAAALDYRRERGLLSGEDLRAWLAERDLDADDLAAYLRRKVARGAGAGQPAADALPSAQELAASLRAEAMLGGALARCGELLAKGAGAARARGTLYELPPAPADDLVALARADELSALDAIDADELEAKARRVAALAGEFSSFCAEIADDESMERTLRRHRLDWQRYHFRHAAFTEEPAAREAALCVRQDGMSLDEVAGLARVAVLEQTQRLDEVDKQMNGVLLATAPGELAGPYRIDDSYTLVQVLERTAPDPDDPQVRELARSELVADALERHLVGRVHWHVAV